MRDVSTIPCTLQIYRSKITGWVTYALMERESREVLNAAHLDGDRTLRQLCSHPDLILELKGDGIATPWLAILRDRFPEADIPDPPAPEPPEAATPDVAPVPE